MHLLSTVVSLRVLSEGNLRLLNMETNTTSAARLRHTAATIASDLAHAPLRNRHYEELKRLNAETMSLEKTLTTTSDTLTSAITSAQDLVMETHRWTRTAYDNATVRTALDHSLASIEGLHGIAVSSEPSSSSTKTEVNVTSSVDIAHDFDSDETT